MREAASVEPEREDAEVELGVLTGNYAAGTCVGEPADDAQQEVRLNRIGELNDTLSSTVND